MAKPTYRPEVAMPVPDYQSLMLPLLKRLAEENEPVPVRKYLDAIADEFGLTEEERAERIPSGIENLLSNRLAWARTYLGKAGFLYSPRRGVVCISERGRRLLAEGLPRIDLSVLRRYPEFVEWMHRSQPSPGNAPDVRATATKTPKDVEPVSNHGTPRERIDAAQHELDEALKAELLDRVRAMTPSDFEDLVIRVLLAMGYGEGQEEMAKALGGTGDGGVDGVVHQDPLGLERVYVQAKRYKEKNNVSSPDIRNFIGALNIHRASKGVFVTASEFTSDARAAASNATVQVVLIDGERLSDLMLRYKVGVLVRSVIEIKDIDEGFFED
jgi:restriction system protein